MFQEFLNRFAVALVQATEVCQWKDGTDAGQSFFFQSFPDGVAGEKEDRFRMIYDMVYIIRIEVLQDRYYDGPVGNGRHVSDAPTGIIFSDDCDFISPAQTTVLEKQMKFGYFFGYFTVSITFRFTIIGIENL